MCGENIETIISGLESSCSGKIVVGEPMVRGNITIIPLVSTSFGFVRSGGEEAGRFGNAGIDCHGVGVRFNPVALIIVQGEKIKLYSLTRKISRKKLVELIPEALFAAGMGAAENSG